MHALCRAHLGKWLNARPQGVSSINFPAQEAYGRRIAALRFSCAGKLIDDTPYNARFAEGVFLWFPI